MKQKLSTFYFLLSTKQKAFTLIELLVTATIIILMAVVAIPSFGKHQALIDLQNKSDEVKAGMDEMQVNALNAKQGVTGYYMQIYPADNKVEYGSFTRVISGATCNVAPSVLKTINLTPDQTLSNLVSGTYLVCDKGKSYCYKTSVIADSCSDSNAMAGDFFTIINSDINKTTTFTVFANPFRVTTTTP